MHKVFLDLFFYSYHLFNYRSENLMVPTLSKKGAASFVQSASTDPFTIEWYMKMTDNADLNKDLESRFTLKDSRFHDTPTLIDFAVVYETFYKHHRVWPQFTLFFGNDSFLNFMKGTFA